MPDGRNQGPDTAKSEAAGRPLGREAILAIIDSALAARTAGHEVAHFFAPRAKFRIAGEPSLYGDFPAGPGEAVPTVADLMRRVSFDSCERIDAVVDGNRAACRWIIHFSIDGGAAATTEVCDLWTFDDEGRIAELVQFVDSALLVRMLG
ncbi:MAG TPA: nuclear transport factor 2 family protein [Allosphingosinicella sp.]|nr:nuclear transport factor 2 family protein [Allosphingosinicella sp.]